MSRADAWTVRRRGELRRAGDDLRPGLVVPTVAATFGIREDRHARCATRWSSTCRRWTPAGAGQLRAGASQAAPVVGELLAGAPGLKVLVTSRALAAHRRRAGVPGAAAGAARRDGATPASTRCATSHAVALFVERARAVAARLRADARRTRPPSRRSARGWRAAAGDRAGGRARARCCRRRRCWRGWSGGWRC